MIRDKYSSRILGILIIFFGGYVLVIGRLLLLQVVYNDFYMEIAKNQYQTTIKTDPIRAAITDRYGHIIALNIDKPSIFLLPQELKNKNKIQHFLQSNSPKLLHELNMGTQKKFMWVDRKIDQDRLTTLFQQLGRDACLVYESKRYYPLQAMASVVGFTDVDNNGLAGVELTFSEKLQGKSQKIVVARDARSRHFYFDKEVEKDGVQGSPIQLTIDSRLQMMAYEELKKSVEEFEAKDAAVLIMDPVTGEVLTMANYPSFDPNQKVTAQDVGLTKNNIVSECYEMGSVMKIFTALAALQEGVTQYDEIINCGYRFVYIDGYKIENPTITLNRRLEENKGKIPFHEVVRYSSNVGIARVAKRLNHKLYDYFLRFGFGSKTGIAFPGERDGFVNPPHNWSKSSVLVMAFGYEVTATILHLGKAMSIIANGGYQVEPNLIKSADKKNQLSKRLFDKEPIAQVHNILEKIGKRFSVRGCAVKGKTGTARCLEDGAYSNKKHIYSFAGIVEQDGYSRVVVTFVRETKKAHWWASQVAGPLFERIANKMVAYEHGVTNNVLL